MAMFSFKPMKIPQLWYIPHKKQIVAIQLSRSCASTWITQRFRLPGVSPCRKQVPETWGIWSAWPPRGFKQQRGCQRAEKVENVCLLKTLDPNYSCHSADGLHPIHPPISRTGVAPNLKETGGWPRGAQSGAGSGRRPPSIRSNVSSEAVVPAWLARCSEQRNNRVEAQQVAGFAILYLYAIIICRCTVQ